PSNNVVYSPSSSSTSSPYDAALLFRLRVLSLSISCCFACIFSTPKRSIAPLVDSKPASVSISRSGEHTSELQSREHLVCSLLLEKKTTGKALGRACEA